MALWRRTRGRHELGAAPRATAIPEVPAAERVPEPAVVPGPRVELTFRDGSSAELDPASARVLADVAQVLTQRD